MEAKAPDHFSVLCFPAVFNVVIPKQCPVLARPVDVQIVQELEMLLKLDHPNIIKIFEAFGRMAGFPVAP